MRTDIGRSANNGRRWFRSSVGITPTTESPATAGRACAAPGCSRVFVDESRNRSRVYCDSRTCGNRMHVAAYRARRRA